MTFHRCANQIQISYPLLIRTRQLSNYSRARDLLHRGFQGFIVSAARAASRGLVLRRSIPHHRVVGSGSRASIAIYFVALCDNPSASNRCKRRSGSLPEAEPESNKAHKQDYGRSNGRSAERSKHRAFFRAGHVAAYFSAGCCARLGVRRPWIAHAGHCEISRLTTPSEKGNHG